MSDIIILEGEMSLSQIIDGDVDLALAEDGENGIFMPILPILQENKTATPTEQAQIITPDPQFNGLRKATVNAIPSNYVGSGIVHDPTPTVSGATVNIPTGYYSQNTSESVLTTQQATPVITVNGGNITATATQSEGYVQSGTKTATATIPAVQQAVPVMSVNGATVTAIATQSAGLVDAGTETASATVQSGNVSVDNKTITANPSISVDNNGEITASVSGNETLTATVSEGYVNTSTPGTAAISGTATSQLSTMVGQTITPSTSAQTLNTIGKYMIGNVVVNAMPTGTAGTPTATKGTVVNNSVTVTPSVINTAGYISSETITGTGVSVSANELVSGTLSVTQNGLADVTNYAGIDVNVAGGGAVKMGVIRPDAELVQRWTYDKMLVADEGITLPSYSTTSQTLKATANIATYDGTPTTYRYFITQRCLTIPVYNIATLAKGREEYVYSVYGVEWVYQPQGELCTLDGTKTYGQYSQMTAIGPFTREVVWNSATALNVYTSPAYCLAQNLQVPAITANKTITIKSPTVTIRGHTSYLTQTFYEAITDARLQYVIELWRVPNDDVLGWITGSQMRSLYEDIANNGGTLR